MKLSDLKENDRQLAELLPTTGAVAGTTSAGAVRPGVQSAPGATAGLASGQMDPAQAAQAAKDRQDQKRQLQDQIRQTEKQLNDLRKQLASLG